MPELPSKKESGDILAQMPPCDTEAERAVLGVMMAYEDAQAFGIDHLIAEDFYGFGHDKVFLAMQYLYNRGETINVKTVGHEMKKNNWIEEIGGDLHLVDMCESSIRYVGGKFLTLINIVSSLGIKRRLIVPLSLALNQCYELNKTPNHIVDLVQQEIFNTLRHSRVGDPISLKQIFKNEINLVEEIIAGKELPGVMTGFRRFDMHTGSMFPGDLFVIAGVPGSGKTIFATDIGVNAANMYKKKVFFVSMEMYERKYAPRLISNQTGIPHRIARLRDYRGHNLHFLEYLHKGAVQATEDFHAHMDGPLNALEIKTKAKKHAIVHGLDLLIVDHLHEMNPINRGDSDYDRASYGAEIMKETAMELKVPVILLSQLNREINHRPDPRPRMSDLRSSGKIEAKADIVGMIFRPGMYDQSNSTEMEFSLEKYRDDERKIFKFVLNGNNMKYEESNEAGSISSRNTDPDSTPF